MKSALITININKNNISKYTIPLMKKYCQKHKIDFIEITEPKINIKPLKNYNSLIFEKFQIYDYFNSYTRIIRLDIDCVINKECPNLFDIVNFDEIGAVYEDVESKKEDRIKEIELLKKNLGNVIWNNGYINSGVIVVSNIHKELFNYNLLQHIVNTVNLGYYKEQNLLNWRIRKFGFKIKNLGYKFNHLSFFKNKDKQNSYIIHFAGNQSTKEKEIKKFIENLK